MARVFVTRELPFPALERLEAEHEVDTWPGDLAPEPEELRRHTSQADGLLSMVADRVDEALLDAAPHLRAIANYAVGTDNIDLEAAAARGIPVGNTPDVLTDATADLAFALILALARGIVSGAETVRAGEWRTGSRPARSGPTSRVPRWGSSVAAGSAKRSRAAPPASGWRSSTARAPPGSRSTSCSNRRT